MEFLDTRIKEMKERALFEERRDKLFLPPNRGKKEARLDYVKGREEKKAGEGGARAGGYRHRSKSSVL